MWLFILADLPKAMMHCTNGLPADKDVGNSRMAATSIIEVNLATVDHNMDVLRRTVGAACRMCAVIKADAYGFGAVRIGRHLVRSGVDMLAVYDLEQAIELLDSAVDAPVLVLMPLEQADVRTIRRSGRSGAIPGRDLLHHLAGQNMHLTIHDERSVDLIVAVSERIAPVVPVHLSIDTGMRCGGCSLDQVRRILARISSEPSLTLAGVYTHFACADRDIAFTADQLARYERVLQENASLVPDTCLRHVSNTFATFTHKSFHKSMVRVGLGWAGYAAESMQNGADQHARHLRPTLTWRSRLVHVKNIPCGSGLGYGQRWTARRDSVIGLVPVGYADGYPYSLGGAGSRARVAIVMPTPNGPERRFAPVVGAVNMDQITIDLTDIVSSDLSADHVRPGTEVELITASHHAPNHLPRLAALAETLPHAILCGLNPRIERIYRAPAAVVHTLPAAIAATALAR